MSQLALLDVPAAEPVPEAPPAPNGDGIARSASLSPDGLYRWWLRRRWADGPTVCWVMLNPSSADAQKDDPTILRCMAFARAWGAAAIEVVNLCALRSSHPDALYDETKDVIGRENDRAISTAAEDTITSGGKIVAAWGCAIRFDQYAPFFLRDRDQRVLDRLRRAGNVYCLGKTASGAPKHPLARGKHRVPDDAMPLPFAPKLEGP